MFFPSAESRAKHAFIDESIENALDQLTQDRVVERLGPHAQILEGVLGSLCVANVRHGHMTMPRNAGPDTVPVVALSADEAVLVRPREAELMPAQKAVIRKKTSAWLPEKGIEVLFETISETARQQGAWQLEVGNGTHATVRSSSVTLPIQSDKIGKYPYRTFHTRPVMGLAYRPDRSRVAPGILVHESCHVSQMMMDPILRLSSQEDLNRVALERELKAYHMEHFLLRGLYEVGYRPRDNEILDFTILENGHFSSLASRIERLRHETNKGLKDAFSPNGTLRKVIEAAGTDYVYKYSKD